MNIRQAKKEDARLLSRLSMSVQRLHAEAFPDVFKFPEQDDYALSAFEKFLADPEVYIYIAEDPQPAGYIICQVLHRTENPFTVARSHLYIDQISVEPDFQGRGIGKALVANAAQLAEQKGLSNITLNSWAFNQKAHTFFQSQGYEIYNVRMWKRSNNTP